MPPMSDLTPGPVPVAHVGPDATADDTADAALAVAAVRAGLAVIATAPTRDVVAVKGHAADLLTATDLAAEEAIRAVLSSSDLPVQGEEGSPDLDAPDRWIVDPVDGTANFVADIGLVASNVALARGGRPVAGATGEMPSGRIVWSALGRGTWEVPPSGEAFRTRTYRGDLAAGCVTVGDFSWTNSGPWPGRTRARIVTAVSDVVGRLRMVGSSATELIWVATGRTSAAVLFGNHPWDTAAGVLAVREAGGVALDVHGEPWTFGSDSVLAAATEADAERLLDVIGNA
ncbi:myo-inositol-1(or 4)-monophosphatase [Salana multivorans]|uniref:Myo-inositol-1(Or 4)-monophosphatase n=2 Tax=Salana multivorans TaxID=120377 RepID=A0A3N2D899_9MICO|nr:myo-inositol-1(or 4)-monophosphatase [Salana multivorans]